MKNRNDNTKPIISICIPVYNQYGLLKEQLEELLKYPGRDIEIVVSDNCSEEDIEGLVRGFHDSRLRYCKTGENLGHDVNILNSFRNCRTGYAFLLRTRDRLKIQCIPKLTEAVRMYPKAAYMRFSADDGEGNVRLTLEDEFCASAEETVRADGTLLIHPSGELYNLRYLTAGDLDRIQSLLVSGFPEKNAFLTHILIRHLLAGKGPFATVSHRVWDYAYTYKAEDRAVVNGNETRTGYSPYSPRYQYPRFSCEAEYICKNVPKKLQALMLWYVVKRYADKITLSFGELNENEGMRAHYNCVKEDYSSLKETFRFLGYTFTHFGSCGFGARLYIRLVSCYLLLLGFPLKRVKNKLRSALKRVLRK